MLEVVISVTPTILAHPRVTRVLMDRTGWICRILPMRCRR